MKRLNVLDCGIVADGVTSCSEALQQLIADNLTDTEFYFPSGTYYLRHAVRVEGASNIALLTDDARMLTHFDACENPAEYNDAFRFTDCSDLRIQGFTFNTDNPVNNAGTVVAIDREARTYDVKIDDAFPMTGEEHLYGSNTCDDEGTPDYVLATYDKIQKETITLPDGTTDVKITGVIYEMLENNTIRVTLPEEEEAEGLRIGHRIMYRYVIYGNTVFSFHSCHRVEIKDIEVERCTSMAVRISPRSSDFTIENLNMRSPEGDPALFSANADGVHILGLSGYFKMKDCTFVGLGDDALNIHSTAGEIEEIAADGKSFHCVCNNRHRTRPMPPEWAREGDVLVVYDRETLHEKGRVTLADYAEGDIAVVASVEGEFAKGDFLANAAYFASVHLENCEVRNTRARGFLLQTHNVVVDNCRVYGMSLPAIIVAPDLDYWYEVGPSKNVEIRNCTFEKCAFLTKECNRGMVVVKVNHDDLLTDVPAGVHNDLRILNNQFIGCSSSGVFVSGAKDVKIAGNRFERCSAGGTRPNDLCDIAIHNTDDVVIADNTSDRDAAHLLYTENCHNVQN